MTTLNWTNCTVALGDLKPWADNPRFSTKAQAKRILDSFKRFDQVLPIAVGPANEVYDGHQRLSALLTIHGKNYEIDARRSNRALTDDERRALTLAINGGAVGSWNWDALANWDGDALKAEGFDADMLAELNASAANLAAMLEADKPAPVEDVEPAIDRAEELREKWGVETGQLWRLGDHRLICGDCTDRAVVERVMGGERASLAPVDPPYNVGFDYDGQTVDDKKASDVYEAFSRAWFGACQSVSIRQIVTPGCYNLASWMRWFDPYHVAPWTKTAAMTNGKVSRFWCWEPMLFFGSDWSRSRANDVFHYEALPQSLANGETLTGVHPCPKPLSMWIDLIENYSNSGDVIFESFSGSGTTLIACERLGRRCRAVEISPAYVAVALERWSVATGKTPELVDAS